MKDLTPPRYLVIADYPNSHYEIGQIIELSVPKDASGWDMVTLANNEEIMPKYPHLFRLLHWWEFRELSDLPIYVKYSTKGKIIKVKWIYVQDGEGKVQLENGGYRVTWSFNLFEPATLNEYNEYIKSLSLIKTIENE